MKKRAKKMPPSDKPIQTDEPGQETKTGKYYKVKVVKRQMQFSLTQLVIFILLFGAVGGYALVRSFAASTCPYGTTHADGCSSAPAGTPQYPNMLSSYNTRPPWNVAGVDYHVGIPSGTTLTPWRSASTANVSFDLAGGSIRCTSAGASVTLDAIDFSTASGVSPYIYDTNGCSWAISNSKFTCPGAYSNIIADRVTLTSSEMDQSGCSGSPSSMITGGSITMKYDWFHRSYQHVLESGGPGSIDYRYNLIDDSVPGGAATGQHENFQQLSGTSSISADTISFNTAYQHTSGSGNGEGYQFYCNSGPCAVNNPILSNNTTVALPGTSMSYVVNGGDTTHPGNIVNGTNSNNYFDTSGAFGAYYTGTITTALHWTSSGNINMTNGKTINPADNSESGGPTANVFVAANGSDAGANCKRYATPVTFPGGTVCATFNKAYQLASCGDVVEVEGGGTYGDQGLTNDAAKATCASNVVIRPASGAGSTQVGLKTDNLQPTGNDHGIFISGADHVTVSGFRNIHGELEVDNCTVGSVFDNVATSDGNLYVGGQTNDIVIKNSSWGGTNRYFPKVWIGGCGDGQNHNLTIGPGNVTHDVFSDDLGAAHVDGILVAEADGLTIKGNTFYNNLVDDIAFGQCCGMSMTDAPVIVENNFLGHTGNESIAFQGNKTHWANFNVRNNTGVDIYQPFDCTNGCSGNKFSGNINPLTFSGGCNPPGTAYSHNAWIGPVTCGGTGEIHVADAMYVNPVNSGLPDLHLRTGSPAINAGDPLNFPITDIDGETRPAGAGPDAGADETGGSITPPPPSDTTPPTVSLTAPANGASVSGSSVTVSANASDNIGVAGVQFKLDGANLNSEDTTSPYSIAWNSTTAGNGSHTLSATARDAAGNTTSSSAVTVTVSGSTNILLGNQTVESWADPISVGQSEAWSFAATATGNAGSVSLNLDTSSSATAVAVGLYADSGGQPGSLLATANLSSPLSGWNSANFSSSPVISSGNSYWLAVLGTGSGQLVVRDHNNGSCTAKVNALPNSWTNLHNPFGSTDSTNFNQCPLSAYITGSGAPSDTIPPTVSITAPANGATVAGTLSVTANASDNVAVSKVEFYIDGTLANTDTASPYSYSWNSTTVSNGAHTITAKAYDAAGNSVSSQVAVTVSNGDTTSPSTPTNLLATASAYNQVNLSWTASTDNVGVAGYYIVRNGTTVAQTSGTGTTYTDTPVNASSVYNYQVMAYDAKNNTSGLSNVASTVTPAAPDTQAPSAPAGLSATAVSSSQINLAWNASTDNVGVSSYDVYRNSTKVASVAGATTSFGDASLAASTSYSYYVIAKDAAGNSSAASASASAMTQPATPPASTGSISGIVSSSKGGVVAGATVSLSFSGSRHSYSTNFSGSYTIPGVPAGGYSVKYTSRGFTSLSLSVSVTGGNVTTQNVTLVSRK